MFLGQATGLMAAALPLPAHIAARAADSAPTGKRKKIAFLGTMVRTIAHAQHFLDRLTRGYTWEGKWQFPRVDVAGVYIDQFPEGPAKDLGMQRIRQFHLKQYSCVADALTLGGSKLAVDGVVIIGEHGTYPKNEKGQTLYPRYQWFKEIVKVFEASGRSVPVFNDKHLSTTWSECKEMVDDARRLGFPLMSASSLPVTRRMPEYELPFDADLTESVCVAYGGVDSYDFHAYETAQCMSERRKGGETGIESVLALKGPGLWEYLETEDRAITRDLLAAALSRSHNLPVETGYPAEPISYAWAKKYLPATTIGFFVRHRDGFRTTVFLTGIRDFNYAGYLQDKKEIVSCQMYLPMPGHGSTTADFFNPLTRHMENLFLTGKSPLPIERTLLTSGMVIGGVESLARGQKLVETPEMKVSYHAPRDSGYWKG